MTKDPKITLDTVRLSIALESCGWAPGESLIGRIRDAAALEYAARRVGRLNERFCNEPDRAEIDKRADSLVSTANRTICAKYGARLHRYGQGSGLFPHVTLSDGSAVSL